MAILLAPDVVRLDGRGVDEALTDVVPTATGVVAAAGVVAAGVVELP